MHMTEPFRLLTSDGTTSSGSPDLRPPSPADPRFGRAGAIGAVIGFLLVGAGAMLTGYLAGLGAGGSLGLAVLVGFFGGCGWGGMVGATACAQRAEARERSAREQVVDLRSGARVRHLP
jgi:hypothetical protein